MQMLNMQFLILEWISKVYLLYLYFVPIGNKITSIFFFNTWLLALTITAINAETRMYPHVPNKFKISGIFEREDTYFGRPMYNLMSRHMSNSRPHIKPLFVRLLITSKKLGVHVVD